MTSCHPRRNRMPPPRSTRPLEDSEGAAERIPVGFHALLGDGEGQPARADGEVGGILDAVLGLRTAAPSGAAGAAVLPGLRPQIARVGRCTPQFRRDEMIQLIVARRVTDP